MLLKSSVNIENTIISIGEILGVVSFLPPGVVRNCTHESTCVERSTQTCGIQAKIQNG